MTRKRCLAILLLILGLISTSKIWAQVTISYTQVDDAYELLATSSHIIPVYVRVRFDSLTNLEPDRELPVMVLLEPGATDVPLMMLTPTTETGRRAYSINYLVARGNPLTAEHDQSTRYLFPFAHGTKRRLSQGFHGEFTHQGENEYAVDFEMPEGTEVYAARGGLVAEVKEESTAGGTGVNYTSLANRILILHEDGSLGNYVHLRFTGAVVEPGDRVEAGDLIGYSGNTGRSTGPHLHFDVRLPMPDATMQSVPFVFAGDNGEPVQPVEGYFYYSYHPGGEPFEAVIGRELKMSDYAEYAEPLPATNEVEVNVEQIDRTYLVFVQNGTTEEQEIAFELDLVGLSSDQGTEFLLTVEPLTERLATIMRPDPGAGRLRYRIRLRH